MAQRSLRNSKEARQHEIFLELMPIKMKLWHQRIISKVDQNKQHNKKR